MTRESMERVYRLVQQHVPLDDAVRFAQHEEKINKSLYDIEKCVLPPECFERGSYTATAIVKARNRILHECMCEPALWSADKKRELGEPATENILKDIGGINMGGREFVTLDNIDKVVIRTRDGREFEGTATRAEYMPGVYGAAGYSDLTVRTLKQTATRNYGIKEVIFNNPATVVKWDDGTQTVVYCQDNSEEVTKVVDGKKVKVRKPKKADTFNPEIGLAMAIVKKHFGNLGNYNNVFHKYIPKVQKERKAEKEAEE